jgi:hypothetical protein
LRLQGGREVGMEAFEVLLTLIEENDAVGGEVVF